MGSGGAFLFNPQMTRSDKWQQHGNWHIRDEEGRPVNLNSAAGAAYVLRLQGRVQELESPAKSKRRRRKVGPSETKQGA